MKKRVSLPLITRQATVQPETLNVEKRTVDIIFSTGARVKREMFFSDSFHEELSLNKKHVRLERLNNGAPFLDSHGHSFKGLRDVIGVITKANTNGKEGRATVRFSKRADVEPIFQDVKDGILQHVSVGYRVHTFKEMDEAEDGLKVFRAVDWEPIEISQVAAGADDGAKVRSEKAEKYDCEVITNERDDPENSASERQEPPVAEPPAKPGVENKTDLGNDKTTGARAMDPKEKAKLVAEAKADGIKAEQERQTDIRKVCRLAKKDDKYTDALIVEGISVDEVRTRVINSMAEKDKETQTHSAGVPSIEVGREEAQTFREGVVEALLHKYRGVTTIVNHMGQEVKMPGFELTEKGRPYVYRSLIELARMSLERNGMKTAMLSRSEIAKFALLGERAGMHSTSDFPLILEDIVNKTLRQGYTRAPITWQPFTRETTAPDFKTISRTNIGDGEVLEKVLEHGEFKRGTKTEAAEKYNIETFGKIFSITRQALINDDLNVFTRTPERLGRRARDLESDEIWGLIFANAALSDGFALFSTDHSNLAAVPAIPTEDGLSEGRQSMRLQIGLDGEVIALVPRWMYTSAKDETAAEKLIASIVPDSSTNVSPFSRSGRTPLQLAVEPRIDTLAGAGDVPWFLSAELDQVDMIEIARLEGTEGPVIESRLGFDVDGMEIKVRHDIGTKAIDHRGLFKNVGVT